MAAGLSTESATMHSFHAVSLGPKLIGTIFSSSETQLKKLMDESQTLRPNGGPFLFNAVVGVMMERGVGYNNN